MFPADVENGNEYCRERVFSDISMVLQGQSDDAFKNVTRYWV